MSVVFLAAHTIGPLAVLAGWLGSVRWVCVDARARLRNPRGGRAAVIAAAVAPGFGLLVWLCMRPCETLLERRERRLWTLLLEGELRNAAREEELRRVRQDDRARPAAREVAHLGFDPGAGGSSRLGDEADGQHAVDEPVLVELLPKRELAGFELGEQAAAG
jgi:hypothetical protein